MKRFKFLAAAALLAGMAISGATPARAALILTITQDGNGSETASYDTTTHMITSTSSTGTAVGTFSSSFNPITGENTLAFNGTVGNVFFDLSVASTTNTPGSANMAMLNLGSNTISNLNPTVSQLFSIVSSASGYTQPTGNAIGNISNSGTLTSGSIAGSFTGAADGWMPAALTISASGAAVSLANNPPPASISISSPYTISETLSGTLGASSTTAGLSGTVTITNTPEPSTVAAALSGLAVVGLASVRRKRRNGA